jgi:hypothetical protein
MKTYQIVALTALLVACGGQTTQPYTPQARDAGLQVPSRHRYGPAFTMVDWNKDGTLDALAANALGEIRFYDGKKGFARDENVILKVPSANGFGASISTADADGDGDLDIYAASKQGKVSVYENKGNNTF